MSVVISPNIVLSADELTAGVNSNNPRIGWQTVLTEANVSADEEASGFLVTRLVNPATHLRWKGTTPGDQNVTIALSGGAQTANYFGIAGHNLGTAGATVTLQGSDNGSDWSDLHDAILLADDFVFMFEFEDASHSFFRLHLEGMSAAPEIAVLYIGQVLRLQRRIYVGHKPLVLNISSRVSSGYSEDGRFLGRILRSQKLESSVSLNNLTPTWVRSAFLPFQRFGVDEPFFFAWRPGDYPNEVGYCWLVGDPSTVNERPNGMMQLEMNIQGIR